MFNDSIDQPKRAELSREEIAEIVRGLDPVDWVHLRVISKLSPEKKILAGIGTAEFARAIVRGTLTERFPNETRSDINMRVLRRFTPVRMDSK